MLLFIFIIFLITALQPINVLANSYLEEIKTNTSLIGTDEDVSRLAEHLEKSFNVEINPEINNNVNSCDLNSINTKENIDYDALTGLMSSISNISTNSRQTYQSKVIAKNDDKAYIYTQSDNNQHLVHEIIEKSYNKGYSNNYNNENSLKEAYITTYNLSENTILYNKIIGKDAIRNMTPGVNFPEGFISYEIETYNPLSNEHIHSTTYDRLFTDEYGNFYKETKTLSSKESGENIAYNIVSKHVDGYSIAEISMREPGTNEGASWGFGTSQGSTGTNEGVSGTTSTGINEGVSWGFGTSQGSTGTNEGVSGTTSTGTNEGASWGFGYINNSQNQSLENENLLYDPENHSFENENLLYDPENHSNENKNLPYFSNE